MSLRELRKAPKRTQDPHRQDSRNYPGQRLPPGKTQRSIALHAPKNSESHRRPHKDRPRRKL